MDQSWSSLDEFEAIYLYLESLRLSLDPERDLEERDRDRESESEFFLFRLLLLPTIQIIPSLRRSLTFYIHPPKMHKYTEYERELGENRVAKLYLLPAISCLAS